MAELRRLLIQPNRIAAISPSEMLLSLNKEEVHYLGRVLRLRPGHSVEIIDGIGRLWEAKLHTAKVLKFGTSPDHPLLQISFPTLELCLAVVVPKRGFDEVIRMSCELGVNVIQPLISQRRAPQAEDRLIRWNAILREAVEQSEQLWMPKLLPSVEASYFWKRPREQAKFALATARRNDLLDLQLMMARLTGDISQFWVAIGPEGGWSPMEISDAQNSGWIPVGLGESILRTSTAAIAATQTMVSTRRIKNLS